MCVVPVDLKSNEIHMRCLKWPIPGTNGSFWAISSKNSLFKAITHSAIINLSKKMRLGIPFKYLSSLQWCFFFWGRGDNDLIMFLGFLLFSIELKALHGIWQIHGPIWRWLDYSGMINNESYVEPTHARKECFAWKKTHQQSAAVEEVNKKDVAVWISN